MQLQFLTATLLAFLSLAVAAPARADRKGNAAGNAKVNADGSIDAGQFGRPVLDGAKCTKVQGRLVCDDGTGNTL